MPVIPHELPDGGVVLLFHMWTVVPLVRTGTGEGDVRGMTEVEEMSAYELAPVVSMQREGAPSNMTELVQTIWPSPPRQVMGPSNIPFLLSFLHRVYRFSNGLITSSISDIVSSEISQVMA